MVAILVLIFGVKLKFWQSSLGVVDTSGTVGLVCNLECKIVQSLTERFHLGFESIDVFLLCFGEALLKFYKTTNILNFVFLLERCLMNSFNFFRRSGRFCACLGYSFKLNLQKG